jgi:hypothetical protein
MHTPAAYLSSPATATALLLLLVALLLPALTLPRALVLEREGSAGPAHVVGRAGGLVRAHLPASQRSS